MKLYIRQKIFSWKDKFTFYDSNGNDKYHVEGEFFSFGKKLHVYDSQGREAAYIEQKLLSFLPRYFVYVGNEQIAEIVKEMSFFRPKYSINGLGWQVEGDFFAHDYDIVFNGEKIVTINKKWMTWGDCYELNINDESDEIVALSVVLAIDCVLAVKKAASSG